jgi:hypothetical protein
MPTKDEIALKVVEILRDARASEQITNVYARSKIEDMNVHVAGYAEPGYTDDVVVVVGDWNEITEYDKATGKFVTVDSSPAELAEKLESAGATLEWCDEWVACADCGKLVRTSGDRHGWKQAYWSSPDGPVCRLCVKPDPEAYLRELEGNVERAESMGIDLEANGYVLLQDDFENGFYGGQDAHPKVIGATLRKQNVQRFIFRLDDVGQFDVKFSVYVHKTEIGNVKPGTFDSPDSKNGPNMAEGLRKSLAAAGEAMDKLPEGGIKVIHCDASTGTASGEVVSPEDFVKGKKQ